MEQVKADLDKERRLVPQRLKAQKDQWNRLMSSGTRATPQEQAKLRERMIQAELEIANRRMEAYHAPR
jgi:hypothetical protein